MRREFKKSAFSIFAAYFQRIAGSYVIIDNI